MLKNIALTTILGLSALGCNNRFYKIDDNFYRSAQLDKKEFSDALDKYEIKTVINMRGVDKGQKWYEEEKSVSKERGVEHHDIHFSSGDWPEKENLIRYIELLKNSEYPILVHCAAGKDRTSLGSAVYRLAIKKDDIKEARKECRRIPFKKTTELDTFLKYYQDQGLEIDFEEWVREYYTPSMRTGEYLEE